ncbi:MAG: DUF4923 family protein [Muribaculaceae bacterium]|nr:DUF4923 family protein [Muribaculaceae bacterium]
MKLLHKIATVVVALFIANSAFAQTSSSSALQGLFGKLTGSSSQTSSSSNESSSSNNSSSSSSGLSNILGALGGVVENLISTDNIEISSLAGTWKYAAPAVAFKSDDLLKKAGGAAVASQVEAKLENYYKYLRLQSMQLTIDQAGAFTMAFNKIALSGNITKDEEGNLLFNFTVAGQINIGTVKTYVTKSGDTLNVMFDVSKLMTILEKVGSYVGNSTISSITSLLSTYDGITAGFKLTRVQ